MSCKTLPQSGLEKRFSFVEATFCSKQIVLLLLTESVFPSYFQNAHFVLIGTPANELIQPSNRSTHLDTPLGFLGISHTLLPMFHFGMPASTPSHLEHLGC